MVAYDKSKLLRTDLKYPETSYIVGGVLIDVFKQLGGCHPEKTYQKAVDLGLKKTKLEYKGQYYVPLKYDNEIVGKYYLDFLVKGPDGSVIVELKRGKYITANLIEQTKKYLTALNLDLAIVGCFTSQGVIIKRILNDY